MNEVLESSWDNYKCLYNTMVNGTKNVIVLYELFIDLKCFYENSCKNIETISQKYHKQISREND